MNLNGKTPATLLKEMLFLRESGYNIPDDALKFVQWQVWEHNGVKEVWNCDKCKEQLELMVRIKGATCKKGHTMNVLWKV